MKVELVKEMLLLAGRLLKKQPEFAYPLIVDGKVSHEVLTYLNKDMT